MYRDITEIRQFYRSRLGRLTARVLNAKIRSFWSENLPEDKQVVGVGYPIPFLEKCPHKRNFAVMSATQGVMRWPRTEPCRTVLTEDHILPFPEASIERLLLVHALENTDYLREFMDEVWRVLEPNGRVLLVVPNRAGLWADSDKTPFGQGRPYSMKQLRTLLHNADFVIEHHKQALYFFPAHIRILMSIAPALDLLGEMLLPKFGGVIIVEATKRLYNVTPVKVASPVKLNTTSDWAEPEPVPAR